MSHQVGEPVEGGTGPGLPSTATHLVGGEGRWSLGQTAVTVVVAVDSQHLEVSREALDLPQEILGGETVVPQGIRQSVGRRREVHATLDERAEQGRDEHRVARVVELELVDGEQAVAAEGLDRRGEPERTDEVGQLDEGAERLRLGGHVPQGRQQVRLAHAEPAVEVDAGATLGRGRGTPQPRPSRRRCTRQTR